MLLPFSISHVHWLFQFYVAFPSAISSVMSVAAVLALVGFVGFWWKRCKTTRADHEELQARGKTTHNPQCAAQYEEIDVSKLELHRYESFKLCDKKEKDTAVNDDTPQLAVHPLVSGTHEVSENNDPTGYDRLTFQRMDFVKEKDEGPVYFQLDSTDGDESINSPKKNYQAAPIDVPPQKDVELSTAGNKESFENIEENKGVLFTTN